MVWIITDICEGNHVCNDFMNEGAWSKHLWSSICLKLLLMYHSNIFIGRALVGLYTYHSDFCGQVHLLYVKWMRLMGHNSFFMLSMLKLRAGNKSAVANNANNYSLKHNDPVFHGFASHWTWLFLCIKSRNTFQWSLGI